MATRKSILIAHEFGHAVVANIIDNCYKCSSGIDLKPEDGLARAYCDLIPSRKKVISPRNKSKQRFSNIINITDLGGIFGELLYRQRFDPWGSREDLDGFITINMRSRSKLISELFAWMWNDDDELSFPSLMKREKSSYKKQFISLDIYDVMKRLPNLWEAYLDFLDKIDRDEFSLVVDEISLCNDDYIDEVDLEGYVNRIKRVK